VALYWIDGPLGVDGGPHLQYRAEARVVAFIGSSRPITMEDAAKLGQRVAAAYIAVATVLAPEHSTTSADSGQRR